MNTLTEKHLKTLSRNQLIYWLLVFDSDGCYTDQQRLAEGFEVFTKETALAKALEQLAEINQ